MTTLPKIFEPHVFSLHSLDREHIEICQSYEDIEETILLGRGLSAILGAANRLVEMMLQHFAHEEHFLKELSFKVLQRHRDTNIEIIAQLLDIEGRLSLRNVAAVVQLLMLGDAWMKQHMQLECLEFEDEGPRPGNRVFGMSA